MRIKKKTGIYSITTPSGRVYIGSAVHIAGRWGSHRARLRKGTHQNHILQNVWNKYGEGCLDFKVVLECSREDLLSFEQIFIDCMATCNLAPKAGNTLDIKRRPESIEKMASKRRGLKLSAEWRAKIGEGLRGRPVSEETRAKLAAQRGWKHSDEARAKMSEAAKRRWAK